MKHLERRRDLLVLPPGKELEHEPGDQPDRASFSQVGRALLKEDDDPVGIPDVLMVMISMFLYSIDIGSSIVGCYWLYGRWWWWISISCLLSSLLVVNAFSMRWYVHDAQEAKDYLPDVSRSHWVLRVLFHVTCMGPIIRYMELFLYALHSWDKKDPNRERYRLMFLQESRDVSYLALVGSFIKSAPQLVLQTYILVQNRIPIDLAIIKTQAVNLVASLVELSLAQSNYHKALRRATPHKHNMTKIGTAFQFVSHACVITSRVLALAAFASLYRSWIFVFCAIHWTIMTYWLIFQQTSFCATATGQPRPLEEMIFNVVLGVIYLFCFINVKEEPTRWKYTVYYIIIWIENVVLVVLWFIRADPELWFRIPLLSSVIGSLGAGLILLCAYYQFLHPNKIWKKIQA